MAKRYFYDRDGRLDCVTNSAGAASDCAAPTGGVVSAALLEDYAYDYRGRLAGYRAYTNGTLTDSSSTGYDPLDRPSSETETHGASSPKTTLFSYVGLTDQLATEEQRQSGSLLTSKSYSYDAFGQRTGLTNTPTSGTGQRYSYGYDPHGNVSLLLNSSGTAISSYGYRAYGAPDTAITDGPGTSQDPLNPYRYTAKRLDSGSGTLDMGARRYASSTGRFLQQDLYYDALGNLGLAADTLTSSRYNLAGGNPIGYVETDGHRPIVESAADYVVWQPDAGVERSLTTFGSSGGGGPTSGDELTAIAGEQLAMLAADDRDYSAKTEDLARYVWHVEGSICSAEGGRGGCDSIEDQWQDLLWFTPGLITKLSEKVGLKRAGVVVGGWLTKKLSNLSERYAARALAKLEVRFDAHFVERHGAQTSLHEQWLSAVNGWRPGGAVSKVVPDSSRFLSARVQYAAVQQALTKHAATGNLRVTIDLGKTIGEGFLSGGRDYAQTSKALAAFDRNGNLKTIFPLLRG